jgi:putative ABC transport system ATP-binding protein
VSRREAATPESRLVSGPGPAIVSALELREVVKHYRSGAETVRAVDGVTLRIEAGEMVALYGPSGSGKTTLLMLAAALIAPDAGSILFGGRDVAGLSPRESARYRRHKVGLITQEFHLMPGAGALDNALIKLPVLGLTLREARARTRPWLQRVGLGERLEHLPEQLSMGERQRVAIARALVGEPGLLLADEPTGSLDSRRTAEILVLLREICRERGIPGLLVTHDADAVDYVDRAFTLRDGHLTESSADATARLSAAPAGESPAAPAGEHPEWPAARPAQAQPAGSRS